MAWSKHGFRPIRVRVIYMLFYKQRSHDRPALQGSFSQKVDIFVVIKGHVTIFGATCCCNAILFWPGYLKISLIIFLSLFTWEEGAHFVGISFLPGDLLDIRLIWSDTNIAIHLIKFHFWSSKYLIFDSRYLYSFTYLTPACHHIFCPPQTIPECTVISFGKRLIWATSNWSEAGSLVLCSVHTCPWTELTTIHKAHFPLGEFIRENSKKVGWTDPTFWRRIFLLTNHIAMICFSLRLSRSNSPIVENGLN
jgi:hypothetical protein